MTLATVNQHGVCSTSTTVRVPIPKSVRARCELHLAELRDGWRFGYTFETGHSYSGCDPWQSRPPFPSRDAALAEGLRRAEALRAITEYRGKHPHLQEEPMTATATKSKTRSQGPKARRHNGNGHHGPKIEGDPAQWPDFLTPDQTGTTIAANDPDASPAAVEDLTRIANWNEEWERLSPRLSELCGRKDVGKEDHKTAAYLLSSGFGRSTAGVSEARRIVAKYFPGESSASPAPLREDPAAESITQSRGGAERDDSMGGLVAKMRAEQAERKDVRNFGGQTVSRINWAHCVPHPANPAWRQDEIDDLAESLKAEGMLEKPVVRPLTYGHPDRPTKGFGAYPGEVVWQILSGHRRIAAAMKNAWREGDAHVVHCDDARALELVAIYNAKRKDLTAIDKAKMIDRLCQPIEQGGSGFTREQAAKVYDLESGAAASNLVRLLELPKVWQDRVASGELPWTWARELCVPAVLQLPPVQQALEKHWKLSLDANRDSWDESAFDSRQKLTEVIADLVYDECRRLDKHYWDGKQHRVLTIDSADPEIRRQLGIVDVELPPLESSGRGKGKLKPVAVATNVKAFDQWLEQLRAGKVKAAAEKVGRDKPAPKRELSAAEKKQRAADRTRQLSARIADWRHKLLRRELVAKLEAQEDSGFRLVLAYAGSPAARGPEIGHVLSEASQTKKQYNGYYTRRNYWSAVADARVPGEEAQLLRAMAINLLKHEANDWRFPTLPHALVEQYAADLGVDVAVGWSYLQRSAGGKPDPLLEEFFLLFRTDELADLAQELGVHSPGNATRGGIVKLLFSVLSTRKLKLPKCIKPLAAAKSKVQSPKSKGAKGTK